MVLEWCIVVMSLTSLYDTHAVLFQTLALDRHVATTHTAPCKRVMRKNTMPFSKQNYGLGCSEPSLVRPTYEAIQLNNCQMKHQNCKTATTFSNEWCSANMLINVCLLWSKTNHSFRRCHSQFACLLHLLPPQSHSLCNPLTIIRPAHAVQWSNHLGAMCSRAWRSQWPRIDSSLGPSASAY